MTTCSTILAWEIPWSLVGYSPRGHKESDITEQCWPTPLGRGGVRGKAGFALDLIGEWRVSIAQLFRQKSQLERRKDCTVHAGVLGDAQNRTEDRRGSEHILN